MRMATPTEVATETETITVAVRAVRIAVRAPAARTAAPYTSLCSDVPVRAICVRLQDPYERPDRADPMYLDRARSALLARNESFTGMQITLSMVRKETQKQWRKDYKKWNNRINRKKKRVEQDAGLLADLGFGPPPPPPSPSPPPAFSWPLPPPSSPPPALSCSPPTQAFSPTLLFVLGTPHAA